MLQNLPHLAMMILSPEMLPSVLQCRFAVLREGDSRTHISNPSIHPSTEEE